jgi:hypothetical protein
MLRTFVCAAVALMLCVGASLAQDKGKGKKNTQVAGTIKKIDAATGTLTISVKGKNTEAKDMEFKVSDTTKVTVFAPTTGDKTQLTGKDGLKNEQFKEGARVQVITDADNKDKVLEVRIGTPKKKEAK